MAKKSMEKMLDTHYVSIFQHRTSKKEKRKTWHKHNNETSVPLQNINVSLCLLVAVVKSGFHVRKLFQKNELIAFGQEQ